MNKSVIMNSSCGVYQVSDRLFFLFFFFTGAEKINDNLPETFPNRSLKVCGVQRSVTYTSQHSKSCCLLLPRVVNNLLIVNIPHS